MKFSLNPATQSALYLTRSFAAPRERVRQAWLDAATLQQWFGPLAALDWKPRVGGAFRLDYPLLGNTKSAVEGEFQDLSDEMLVLAWVGQGGLRAMGGTLVTVEFRKGPQGTELALTHELLPTAAARDAQRHEWMERLERLAALLG